jgi:HAD superfamily hydrolase (TIGR01549 family)
MKYKAALFDLDDTLTKSNVIYNKALRYAASYLASKYSLDLDEFFNLALEKYRIIAMNFPTVHTRHSRILLFRMALDEAVGRYDVSLLPEVEDMYWDYFMENIELYPEVAETLSKIHASGMRTAIVSDGSLSLRIKKAKVAGLLPYFDEVLASEEVIFEKPFSAIYTLALSKLDVDPHEAVMIGNDYKSDIRGAQLVGIRAGLFNPAEDGNVIHKDPSIIPDFEINNFSELLKELEL